MRRLVLAILVRNTSGVLSRVTGLFARRGYNIDSLTVGETLDNEISRITVTCYGDEIILNQIKNQVMKLADVIELIDLSENESVFRELLLIKVSAGERSRQSIIEITNVFRAKIIDIAVHSLVLEITGDTAKNKAFVEMIKPFGIIELIKTGLTGVTRGTDEIGQIED